VTKGIVNIRGKDYHTVAKRVSEFRKMCPITEGWAIVTSLDVDNETRVLVSSKIIDPDGKVVATGIAEEIRQGSNINRTSAVENAETSSIGRCIANAGMGGENFASADEVLRAIEQQESLPAEIPPLDERDPGEQQGCDWTATDEEDSEIEAALEVIKTNIKTAIETYGEEEYKIWHGRVLSNFYGVDSIEKLTLDQMLDFSNKQLEKIKMGEK